jgi:glutamate carboxypeptidase
MPEDLPAALGAAAARHLPEALAWLRRMVDCNSFTANAPGVDAVGRLTAECFSSLGFEPAFVPSLHPDHGHHLFLLRRPASAPPDRRPLVFVTHLDTVFPPEEEARHQFYWRESPADAVIHGPGVVDNKGGTLMIWLLLQILRDSAPGFLDQNTLLIAANAAEEVIGSDFADRTAERCPLGARAVLVFEGGPVEDGTRHHLVTARKGRLEFRIDCHGRAAHAGSRHQDGVNAVVELARLLPQIAALTDPASDLTVNIASIHGGTVLNRVPHHASAELEMRAYDPAVLARAEAALLSLAGTTTAGARIAVTCEGRTQAWPGGPDTLALAETWARAAAQCGLSTRPTTRGGLSDANYLHPLGPTLDGLGPFGDHAHCSETDPASGKLPELVYPASFIPKAVLNALALLHLP